MKSVFFAVAAALVGGIALADAESPEAPAATAASENPAASESIEVADAPATPSILESAKADSGRAWRISVGGQMNFGVKGALSLRSDAIGLPPRSSSSSRSKARAAANGISVGSGRTDFGNGAFIDSSDSAGIAGETWNWYVPSGAMKDGKMSFSSGYSESSSSYEAFGGSCSASDDIPGFSIGLDRDIWTHGPFGIELGLGFAYFTRDKWFEGAAGGYTRTDTRRTGGYVTEVDLGNKEVLGDPWTANPDGSYGAGSFDGPGPVLDINDVSVSSRDAGASSSSKRSVYGPYRITGDLGIYEFQLAAKPYFDIVEWFSVRALVGVGASFREFDVDVEGIGSESFDDWDVYMVCGAGGLFRIGAFCLGCDYAWKFFDDDMDIDGRIVDGSIGDSGRSCRAYVGMEF